ncbi:MAG TPA: cation:proton antiporter [Thermoleophilaceae bacterium]|nr:cation:proton antiporter [Thermoleophilaceae bacterium]
MDPVGLFAVGAAVLAVSALLAGVIDRLPLSFPMIFLTLGLVLGEGATGAVEIHLEDDALRTVAFATLALVLFLDAVSLDLRHVRREWLVPALTLGPGAAIVVAIVAVTAMLVAGLDPVPAFLLGAALASTDPVVLRDVVGDERIPNSVRRALTVEAGTNDVFVLPPVLVLAAVAAGNVGGAADWAWFGIQLVLVGPLLGAAVGLAGAALMHEVDARRPVRREWQALYGIALVLGAFSAGETFGADGFLASFAAGAAVSLSNKTLCDCFLDFGEVIAELLMLVSFVLFGIVLSSELGAVPAGEGLLLAAVALLIARPLALGWMLSVRHVDMSRDGRAFIAWFGPRGLNSLLLILIAVEAGVPNGSELFGLAGFVVLVSVFLHGTTATPFSAWYGRRIEETVHPEERESTVGGLLRPDPDRAPRVGVAELAELLEGPEPPVVVDVRSRSAVRRDPDGIAGAVRVPADRISDWARDQERDRLIVLYCT